MPALLTSCESREIFPIAADWNRRLTFTGPTTIFYVPLGEVTLDGLWGRKCVINLGSVGQPRDRDPRASWALYEGDSVTFRRVAYEHERTAAKVRALPLGDEARTFFADRLARGE